jgi:hypothetical protein
MPFDELTAVIVDDAATLRQVLTHTSADWLQKLRGQPTFVDRVQNFPFY